MASARDIQDIMDLGSGPHPPPPKKKKKGALQPKVTGVSREVAALMGDSVPPIAFVEQKQYKSKPSIAQKLFKPRHWEERPFTHGARADGLVLQHWKRSIPGTTRAPAVTTPTDVEMADGEKEPPAVLGMRFEDEFPSEKWNVSVEIPNYTDEQYEADFKSEDWTKNETDYLLDLCRDFDLRWILIADRYDPDAVSKDEQYPPRTMEQLKTRYYTIAAKMMETHTPASNMTQAEFQLWEKMRNFDAKTETVRKDQVKKLFERTKDEAEEERILLEELHRITKNEEDFIRQRRDLYSRLESAPAIRRTERGEEQSTAMYQTSGGLSMLLQTLLAKERKLKRPMPNGEQATPVEPKRGQPNQYSRRETMDSQAGDSGHQKKGSITQPNVRTLTSAEETRFGVSHPTERLTSGIQFRHEKINRLTMAKSQVQTSKIQAALTELGIPPRLLMPTERVCREFERLINAINILLDARKVSDKIASEIRVLEEHKRVRLGLPKEGEETASADAMQIDTSQITEEPKSEDVNESTMADDTQMGEEDEDEDAEGEKDDTVDESAAQIQDQDEEEDEQDDEDAAEIEEDDDEEDADGADETRADDEDDEAVGEEGDDEEFEVGAEADESDEGEQSEANEAEAADSDDEDNDSFGQGEEVIPVGLMNADEEDQDDQDDEDEEEEGAAEEEDEEDAEEEDEADEAEEPDAEPEVEESEHSRPSSSHSALRTHKRSASVISDASKTGSNRSGIGRKKRR